MTATVIEDMDLGEYNPAAVEKDMETGGKLPPGKYHVTLSSVGELTATQKGVMQVPLKFTVLAGPNKGQTHTERLNDFVNGATEDNKKKSNNRFLLFGSRLGLFDTTGGKYRRVKAAWSDCCGAECVIEIKHEPKKDNPSVVYANITFGGIFSLTDPKVKGVPMATAGDKLPAPAPAKYDTSNL